MIAERIYEYAAHTVRQEQDASMDGMERKHEVYWLRAADGSLGDHPYCPG
jgi:hypothetical protein